MEKQKCENEIHAPHATFFRAVEDLKKCAYIIEYKTNHNRDNPLWLQLMDPFLLFHYHFLSGQENAIKSYSAFKSDEGKYTNWRGHAFENLCLSHIEEIRAAMGISGVEIRYFPWTSDRITDGAQIDLVIERADGMTNLCEMKFTDHPFSMTAQDEETLLHKRRVYQEETGTHQALKLILISASGIKGVKYTEQISRVLTLDDLFDWPISQNRFSV